MGFQVNWKFRAQDEEHISCSQWKRDVDVVFKAFPGGTLAKGPRILKKSAGQMLGWADICTDDSDAGTVESVIFGYAWISSWV